jgi:hypothetical protein
MSITIPVIPSLPNNLLNGTPNDASQVMADFNAVRNGVNNALSSVAAQSGASYIGVTTDARWLGTSVQDALAQLISNVQLNDTGAANTITLTPTPAVTALQNSLFVWFKANNTNTSSTVTITLGSTAATALILNDGSTLPPIGSIIAGQIYGAWYSTGLSKWILINPSRATASATITYTGMTATVTATLNYAIEQSGKIGSAWVVSNTTGTSNATTFGVTGIPAAIVPSTNAPNLVFPCLDNNGSTYGSTQWGTSLAFSKGAPVNGAWTASSNKGTRGWSITLPLD